MEDAKLSTEQQYYSINTGNIVSAGAVSGLPAYTNDNGIGNNPTDATFAASNSTFPARRLLPGHFWQASSLPAAAKGPTPGVLRSKNIACKD